VNDSFKFYLRVLVKKRNLLSPHPLPTHTPAFKYMIKIFRLIKTLRQTLIEGLTEIFLERKNCTISTSRNIFRNGIHQLGIFGMCENFLNHSLHFLLTNPQCFSFALNHEHVLFGEKMSKNL